jgi:hypothetical protein
MFILQLVGTSMLLQWLRVSEAFTKLCMLW